MCFTGKIKNTIERDIKQVYLKSKIGEVFNMLMTEKLFKNANWQYVIDEVKATQKIEGLYMTVEEILFRNYLSGEISEEDVLNNFSICVKDVLRKTV